MMPSPKRSTGHLVGDALKYKFLPMPPERIETVHEAETRIRVLRHEPFSAQDKAMLLTRMMSNSQTPRIRAMFEIERQIVVRQIGSK